MKQFISLSLAATTFAAMISFSSCTKTSDVQAPAEENRTTNGMTISSFQVNDRVDEIVKDLSIDNYSFSFSKTNSDYGVTKTSYGTDNYLVFADPQDMICPDPIRKRFPKVPIWKRPQFVIPTCPDMAIDIHKLSEIENLLKSIDISQYGRLKQIQVSNGGVILASQQTFNAFSEMQLDKFDGLTEDLNAAKFIMLGAPDVRQGGVFNRNFYGYANINDIVFKPYKKNLKDLIRPTFGGCFDPIILKTIKERLAKLNPQLYRGLEVTSLPENRAIAIFN